MTDDPIPFGTPIPAQTSMPEMSGQEWRAFKDRTPVGTRISGLVQNVDRSHAVVDIGDVFEGVLLAPEATGVTSERIAAGNWISVGTPVEATVIGHRESTRQARLSQVKIRFQPPDRYRKQALFAPVGEEGQARIERGRALIVGCGALGSVIAETLVRAGVGFVRIVDRDFVELTNLQRQVLFDEQDVADRLPKAVAAKRKLDAINSGVCVESVVADVHADNVLELIRDIDVILDGTDNFETRLLVNDASLETGVPWINGGCVGGHGQVMTVIPGQSACFRCLVEDLPEPGSGETCDTAGVIGPAVNVVASLQCVDAIKLLMGRRDLIQPVLTVIDVWDGTFRRLKVGDLPTKTNCRACVQGERRWLRGGHSSRTSILCGRNAVQVTPAERMQLSLSDAAERLSTHGETTLNSYLLRIKLREPECEITLFRDGRAIIQGTEDVGLARSLYARYIGA